MRAGILLSCRFIVWRSVVTGQRGPRAASHSTDKPPSPSGNLVTLPAVSPFRYLQAVVHTTTGVPAPCLGWNIFLLLLQSCSTRAVGYHICS